MAPFRISNGDGENTGTFAALATFDDALERAVGGVAVDLDRVDLLADQRRRGLGALGHAVDRHRLDREPRLVSRARHLVLEVTDSGSPGLKRMPTFLALGTTRLISSTRRACSGSPKPGE